MRPSPLRHTVAVLRTALEMGQKEFANMIGRSTATIQAIELGKLELSESLALKIAEETGVSIEWLLKNDVTAPLVDVIGLPLTTFGAEDYRARRNHQIPDSEDFNNVRREGMLASPFLTLRKAFLSSARNKKGEVFLYRLTQCAQDLAKQFGETEDAEDTALYQNAIKARINADLEFLRTFKESSEKHGPANAANSTRMAEVARIGAEALESGDGTKFFQEMNSIRELLSKVMWMMQHTIIPEFQNVTYSELQQMASDDPEAALPAIKERSKKAAGSSKKRP